MSYFLNKLTLLVVVGIMVIVVLSFNEIEKFGTSFRISQKIAYAQWLERKQTTFKTQADCQQTTSMICSYVFCDQSTGNIPDNTCESNYETGWRATLVPIPALYQNIESISLTITTPTRIGTLIINPGEQSIMYTSDSRTKKSQTSQTQTLKDSDITLLTNKMILYELAKKSRTQTTISADSTQDKIYTIAVTAKKSGYNDSDVNGYSLSCLENQCSRDFIDIQKHISDLWQGVIIENTSS